MALSIEVLDNFFEVVHTFNFYVKACTPGLHNTNCINVNGKNKTPVKENFHTIESFQHPFDANVAVEFHPLV